MKAKILVSMFVLLAAAGCASMQTEIIAEPGWIDSITVGHFTTANPVDNELIGAYLRKELSKRGFRVFDYSPYVLTGTIDVHPYYSKVVEARIVLRENSDRIIWSYENRYQSRKEFARHLAKQIKKQLR